MSMDSHSLVLAWQQTRCQSAAASLVHLHRPHVVRCIRRTHLPREMEEDAVQEVFLRMFEALPTYVPARPFNAWLLRIAWNTCANLCRRWHHRRAFSACFEDAALDAADCVLPDRESRPDHALMRREFQHRIQALLDTLSGRERDLMERQWGDDAAMPRPSGAERTALCRVRAKMRRALLSKPAGHVAAPDGPRLRLWS